LKALGLLLKGAGLSIKLAKSFSTQGHPGSPCGVPQGTDNQRLEGFMKIYVGNMPFAVTEDALRVKFEEYGAVEEVTIVTDRDTGRPRGFGFVTMPNEDEAKAAISGLDETELEGRALKVNEARPRRDSGGPRRRGW
jgi:RNA recognition motif-containing protein